MATTLSEHDGDFSCELFGLHNTGTLCYLNSLMQSLASCPDFVRTIIDLEDEFHEKGDVLGSAMSTFFNNVIPSEPKSTTSPKNKIKNESAAAILTAIQKTRVGHKTSLGTGTQEDVFEGLKFLIEGLGKKFESIFYTRYKNVIRCTVCSKEKSVDPASCPPELMINMSDSQPLLQESLNTQENIERYINMHMSYPDEYRCDFCKAQNLEKVKDDKGALITNLDGSPKVVHVIQQFYALSRVSSILMMSFHENHRILFDNANGGARKERITRYFPNEIRIDAKGKILVYRVVAQIEQVGSLGGGHYTAKCLRPRPTWFSSVRVTQASVAVKDAEARLASCQIVDRINELTMKIKSAKRVLQEEQRIADINIRNDNGFTHTAPVSLDSDALDQFIQKYYAVFKFNDTSVTYDVHGFVPTKNTYLVFYHLFQIVPVR